MKKNIIFVLAVLLLALLFFLWGGTNAQGTVAYVNVTGKESIEISLDKDAVYTIDEGLLPVTLEVKDGAIRFVDSVCPDHLCEHYGFISLENEQAICVPARVAVVVGEK